MRLWWLGSGSHRVLFTSLLRAGLWEYLPRPPARAAGRPSMNLPALPQPRQQVPPGWALCLPAEHQGAGTEAESSWLREQPVRPRFLEFHTLGLCRHGPGKTELAPTHPEGRPPTWDSGNMDRKVKRKGSLCPLSPRPHGGPTMSLDLWASVTLPPSVLASTKGPSASPS